MLLKLCLSNVVGEDNRVYVALEVNVARPNSTSEIQRGVSALSVAQLEWAKGAINKLQKIRQKEGLSITGSILNLNKK